MPAASLGVSQFTGISEGLGGSDWERLRVLTGISESLGGHLERGAKEWKRKTSY